MRWSRHSTRAGSSTWLERWGQKPRRCGFESRLAPFDTRTQEVRCERRTDVLSQFSQEGLRPPPVHLLLPRVLPVRPRDKRRRPGACEGVLDGNHAQVRYDGWRQIQPGRVRLRDHAGWCRFGILPTLRKLRSGFDSRLVPEGTCGVVAAQKSQPQVVYFSSVIHRGDRLTTRTPASVPAM